MAEWLVEQGIGETRAALIDDGEIVEMAIELDDGRPRIGAILPARLTRKADATGRGLVTLHGGEQALLEAVPRGLTEGAELHVELIREPLAERGRLKPAKVRAAPDAATSRAGASLLDRIEATGMPIARLRAHQEDRLEALGWSEHLEQAASGDIPFAGGMLRMDLTPAMTLFDVDGAIEGGELAGAGAEAAARAIRRFAIGGSIGIDLPKGDSKAARKDAAAAVDAILPQPFERTAVNGFGFLQIVRRRERASIPEMLRADPIGAAARALVRRAERARGAGRRTIVAHPKLIERLEREQQWMLALAARTGAPIALRADPALAISAGHVETEHP